MTSRVREAIESARDQRGVAFLPYFQAMYPEPDSTVGFVQALVAGGADAIELGIPFSDPLADGPTIQRASQQSLANGMSIHKVPALVEEIRAAGVVIPLIVMTYYNPILAYGQDGFLKDVAKAGVDGLIVVDVPPEEADELSQACRSNGMDFVPLLAPTSDQERIALGVKGASGFVYCVSVAGTTGARDALPPELEAYLQRVRSETDVPLAVGFGISRREHIEALRGKADAAIVASAIIDIIEATPRDEREERVQAYVEVLTGRRQASD
jgi:tryptophan synthase alpha subunit